ncbi:MAG: DUF4390 domain-containing protein [Betaproteobacteria bacterium]|nr:DUF4390 domain-containing protein [Betaproteobacteria bacterium]
MAIARFLIAVVLWLGFEHSARADVIAVPVFALEARDDGYAVSADFEFELNPRLEETLNNGVPLYFLLEFELIRPRWYWFDELIANRELRLRFSYNSLLRQYRISVGALHQNFSGLGDALRVLSRIRNWLVMDGEQVRAGETYVAGLRMRLDTAQLPKPFQLSALTNRDLTLASEWKRVPFAPAEADRAPR